MNGFQEASSIKTFSIGTSSSVIDYYLCSPSLFESKSQMTITTDMVGTNHSMLTLSLPLHCNYREGHTP